MSFHRLLFMLLVAIIARVSHSAFADEELDNAIGKSIKTLAEERRLMVEQRAAERRKLEEMLGHCVGKLRPGTTTAAVPAAFWMPWMAAPPFQLVHVRFWAM